MLDRTEKKLQSYFDNEPQLGADGQLVEIDRVTRLNRRQCDCLGMLHRQVRPDLSVETGLAYGFSSIPILDSMEEHGYGHHIAIDPTQTRDWNGVALAAIEELGFAKRFTWIEARSDQAFPKLIADGRRAQFVFFDGIHTFDGLLTDFFLADQILDVGGLVVVNDMWLPAVRSITSFLAGNMENYRHEPVDHENVFVMRKVKKDERSWDHFAPFDGSGTDTRGGMKKKSWLQRIFAS